MEITNITKGTHIDNIDTANNMLKKVIGLMFRKSGRMLFKFNREGSYGIWMPFMHMSLDLIFIDKDKKIVDIKEDVKPITIFLKNLKIYYPQKKSKYILEIEKGLSNTKNLEIDDILEFDMK
ncbi:MAG: DUF192 domain-containing protein [DPANN group archaeon]|nr:DUF192 domain-containing protein [DPANN group archaeon]